MKYFKILHKKGNIYSKNRVKLSGKWIQNVYFVYSNLRKIFVNDSALKAKFVYMG